MVALIFILYPNDRNAFVSVVGAHPPTVHRGAMLVVRPGPCCNAEEDVGEDAGEEEGEDAYDYGEP